MKEYALPSGLVQKVDTSKDEFKGWFGLRKLLWKYLKILNVAFYDPCCAAADGSDREPIAWDESQAQIVRYNGTSWVAITALATTTTTSTTTTTTTP